MANPKNRTVNVETIVFMSQRLAEFPDQKSLLANNIKTSYELMKRSGLNIIYFNPGLFSDNLLALKKIMRLLFTRLPKKRIGRLGQTI